MTTQTEVLVAPESTTMQVLTLKSWAMAKDLGRRHTLKFKMIWWLVQHTSNLKYLKFEDSFVLRFIDLTDCQIVIIDSDTH